MDGWDEAFLWQRWRYFANDDDDDKEKESHTAGENNVDVDASSSDFNDISDCLMSSADASRLFVASTPVSYGGDESKCARLSIFVLKMKRRVPQKPFKVP